MHAGVWGTDTTLTLTACEALPGSSAGCHLQTAGLFSSDRLCVPLIVDSVMNIEYVNLCELNYKNIPPPSPQIEEPYDPERCLSYPLQLDLDLDRDLGDDESFDVEDCKIWHHCC